MLKLYPSYLPLERGSELFCFMSNVLRVSSYLVRLPADEDEAADSTDHDVVDLTQEEDIRPKTTATSTTNSVNIFSVLSKKRQKRGAELAKAEMEKAKAEKARLEMEKAKAEKAKTTTKPMPTSSSSAVIDITDNRQHTDFCDPKGNNETPVRPSILTSASGRLHHSASMSQGMSQSASQEVMDSDSQRPTLTRFRRFAERYSNVHKSNGYLSARVRSTTVTAVRLHQYTSTVYCVVVLYSQMSQLLIWTCLFLLRSCVKQCLWWCIVWQ